MSTRVRIFVAVLLLALASPPVPSAIAGDADEAVGVRGEWVIEIRDPDGTVAARRELHNALVPSNNLGQLLIAQNSAGALAITADCAPGLNSGCVTPCPLLNPPGFAFCKIVDPRQTGSETQAVFRNLTTVEIPGGFRLRGFFVAARDGTIGAVSTGMFTCLRTTAPSNCNNATTSASLTLGLISPPVPVLAGQQVLMTVNITFATAAAAPAAAALSVPPR